MIDHANVTNPLHAAAVTCGRGVAIAVPLILFAAMLLFGILGLMRHAQGWVEVASEVAAATPMAADGLVAFVSALITAVGAVWLYVVHLAR